jgi:hypothetical protein
MWNTTLEMNQHLEYVEHMDYIILKLKKELKQLRLEQAAELLEYESHL